MNMHNTANLAIVIPAYKNTFLKEALDSIAKQTNKNFTVYIGDDASPYDLYAIVEKYKGILNVVFKRFETNFGGKDLVAQWERCIDMVQEEEWIWLFSDDDIMGTNCIASFYKQKELTPKVDLYHFNVKIIDESSNELSHLVNKEYPKLIDSLSFYKKRLSGELRSFVVEYIFKKETFIKKQRFQNFDLAWSSDIATWVKLSSANGIQTIDNSFVYWRKSAENISPKNDGDYPLRKINALISFLHWAKSNFEKQDINVTTFNYGIFLNRLYQYFTYLNKDERAKVVSNYLIYSESKMFHFYRIKIHFFFYRFFKDIKQGLKKK